MTVKKLSTLGLGLFLVLANSVAFADDKENLEKLRTTTQSLIQLLVEQGAITQEKARALMDEIGSDPEDRQAVQHEPALAQPEQGLDTKSVRVPYVPEIIKQEMTEQIRQDVLAQAKRESWGKPGSVPEWAHKIRWEGDFRFRFQRDQFQDDNTPFIPNYMEINRVGDVTKTTNLFVNATEDRERMRLRARLSMLAEVTEGISAAFRLTTGGSNDPVSTNQTLGNSGNRFNFSLDQAYLKFDPFSWLTVVAGKTPNPWFATDLVWDEDLNFDGVAVQLKPRLGEDVVWFSTLGAFPLQEVELSKDDKWLYGAQTGVDWHRSEFRARFGVAYYDYQNITGRRNTLNSHLLDFTAPQFMQKGNTVFNISQDVAKPDLYALAAEYKELAVTTHVDVYVFAPVYVMLTADYVKNLGFDKGTIEQRTGLSVEEKEQDQAWLVRIAVGMPRIKHRHDWQVFAGYKHLESNAVVDAFTDSDFHLGGTNAKGWIVGGSYGVATNAWLGLRWLSADEITGPPLAIDVLQLDLNVRF